MPYKSDAQRRWAHTPTGIRALGGPKKVAEWDATSKGMRLPNRVKRRAEGGRLKMTPQEQYLYQHHLNNLNGPGKVINPDGSMSTVLRDTFEVDGRHYNIPSVWEGKILDGEAAAERAEKAGWDNWPSYDTQEEADKRYMEMHSLMDDDVRKMEQEKASGGRAVGYARHFASGGKWTDPK